MPAIALLAPVALLLATAGAVAICGSAGWKVDRIVLGVGSLGAILVIVGLWAPVRSSQELNLGQLGFGASFDLRLDAVSFVFSLMVLVPAAILLALQPRPWQETTGAVLGVAASVLAVEAGGGPPAGRGAGMPVAPWSPWAFSLLVRAYECGDGRYPHFSLTAILAAMGGAVAFGAAARAQAAATRREYLGEVIPGLGGFALMGIALGTPLGLAAGLATLAVAAVVAACLPLLPDRAGAASLVAITAAAGLPPALAFGVRVLDLEATFEAGNLLGIIGIAGAATWMVSIIAAARAIGLPAGRGHPASETKPAAAMGLAAATVLAGPALGVVLTTLALPVQGEVMPASAGVPIGGLTSVVTVSTVLPALTLLAPVLVLALVVYMAAGPAPVRAQPRPALFALPAAQQLGRLRDQVRSFTVPDQYRFLVDLRALEAAATRGGPLLWLAALVALAFAVTR